jgi:hypothetical protein
MSAAHRASSLTFSAFFWAAGATLLVACDLLGGVPELPELPEVPEFELPEGELPEGVGVGAGGGGGPDVHRHVAIPMPLDEWVEDEISYEDDDLIDWKRVKLPGSSSVTVELHADEPEAEVRVSVYDTHGLPLGEAVRGEGDTEPVTVRVGQPQSGRLFMKVEATDGPMTLYMLRVQLGDGGGSARPDF